MLSRRATVSAATEYALNTHARDIEMRKVVTLLQEERCTQPQLAVFADAVRRDALDRAAVGSMAAAEVAAALDESDAPPSRRRRAARFLVALVSLAAVHTLERIEQRHRRDPTGERYR